jgi:hypothetical protein
METKKELELKHLAPYLPYGLKIRNKSLKGETFGVYEMEVENDKNKGILNVLNGVNQIPLLHPLDRLTETIPNNGEKENVLDWFVNEKSGCCSDFIEDGKAIWQVNTSPIGGIITYETTFMILDSPDDLDPCIALQTSSDDGRVNETELLRYDQMIYLIERHFDVFGLIEKGLAEPIKLDQ